MLYSVYYSNKRSFLQELYSVSKKSEILVLDKLMHMQSKHKNVFVSQTGLAKMTGFTRETVNRAIRSLCRRGLLFKRKRYDTTSVYSLSHWFYKLGGFLPEHFMKTLKYFSLTKILSAVKYVVERNVTSRLYKSNIFSTVGYNCDRKREQKKEVIVNADKIILSPEMKQAVRLLKLTQWGTIKLMCFKPEAIKYAMQEAKGCNNLQAPFYFVKKRAEDWHKMNKEPINWGVYSRLSKQLNAPESPVWTEGQKNSYTPKNTTKGNELETKKYPAGFRPKSEHNSPIPFRYMSDEQKQQERAKFAAAANDSNPFQAMLRDKFMRE